MIKNFIKKIKNKIKEKTGASMVIVLTTISLLIVVGSTFVTIAFNTYQHSYGESCRQQALYTAKSVLDSFIDQFQTDSNLRKSVRDTLNNAVAAEEAVLNKPIGKDIVKVEKEVLVTNLIPEMSQNDNETKVFLSYQDEYKSKLKVKVKSKYKGFTDNISVILGYTNKASVELSKILSNSMFFTAPIVDLMYYINDKGKLDPYEEYAIKGDVFVSNPLGGENAYSNLATKSCDGDGTADATGGHTLEINNEGFANVLWGKNGMPLYSGDAKNFKLTNNGNKITFKNTTNGSPIYNAKSSDVEKDIYMLNNDLTDFIYADNNNNPCSKNNAPYLINDGNPVPIFYIEKDETNRMYNSAWSKNEANYIEKDLVPYLRTKTKPNNAAKKDVIGNDLLTDIKNDFAGHKRVVIDTQDEKGYYKYHECKQIWFNNTKGNKQDHWFYEDDGKTWHHVEVFETIDPKNPNGGPIYVTGRVDADWHYDEKYSFKRVQKGHEEWGMYGRAEATLRVSVEPVDENGNVKKWSEVQDKNYNIYQYQKNIQKETKQLKKDVLYQYDEKIGPNTWSEVYIRSHYWAADKIDWTNIFKSLNVPISINGSLKCNTDVLLGLFNRGFVDINGNPSNGAFHGYKKKGGEIAPVPFDNNDDAYVIPAYNVLSLEKDVYANGDIRGENLIVNGSIYAVDNDNPKNNKGIINSSIIGFEPKSDTTTDIYGWKHGCKGNVCLEQKIYQRYHSIGAYMKVAKDIVADGYVYLGGAYADSDEKVYVGGNVVAGRYNPDGTLWGNRGVGTPIPFYKFYKEDGSVVPSSVDIQASKDMFGNSFPGGNYNFPGGIYGYRSVDEETLYKKKNRYQMGSGDVICHKTHIVGDIYATGDVFLSNGTFVEGSIYTPGSVYITKGDPEVVGPIENADDPRCRVYGDIYAGKDVVITGGCEIGNKTHKSNIYCGGNFYASGRIKTVLDTRNHDILSGNLYCNGNATIYGVDRDRDIVDPKKSYVGYNANEIFVKGTLKIETNVTVGKPGCHIYCGAISVGNDCEIVRGNDTKPSDYSKYFNENYEINGIKDLNYGEFMAHQKIINARSLSQKTKIDYQKEIDVQIRDWSYPETSTKIYKKLSAEMKDFIVTDKQAGDPDYYRISDNIYGMSGITLGKKEILEINTEKQNVHIVVKGNIKLGDGAKIIVKGNNMAFIYVESINKGVSNKDNPLTIEVGPNAEMGKINTVDATMREDNCGLNIVSLEDDIKLILNSNSKMYSYNYIPNGILYLNLKYTPVVDKVPIFGSLLAKADKTSINANLNGSYVIKRIDGVNMDNIYRWRVDFTNEEKPLIMDNNDELNYSDEQADIDFKDAEWVVIKYQ